MKTYAPIVFSFLAIAMPLSAFADVEINEIMYDLDGTDTNHEWVEIYNNGSSSVDLTGWKFDDGATSKHGLNVPPANGGAGSMVLAANGFVVLADNAVTFLSDHPGFSGAVIDTVAELGNTSDTVAVLDSDGNVVSSVNYSSNLGANGDGNSLQKIDGAWKPSAPTPGAQNVYAPIIPPPSDTSGSSNSQTNDNPADSSVSNSASAGKPALPKITVNAVVPATAIAGADITFSGVAVGADGTPLQNARFIWNFGDGGSKEGQSVIHTYPIAGEYMVVLDAASGEVSGGDRHKIKVISPQIVLSNVAVGGNGFVEISNKSGYELDLSYWQIKSGNKNFILPKNTLILGNGKISIPAGVSGIDAEPNETALLFPNGAEVTKYDPNNQTTTTPKPAVTSVSESAEPAPKTSAPVKTAVPAPAKTAAVAPKIVAAEEKDSVSANNSVQNVNFSQTAALGNSTRGNSIYPYLLALGGIIVVSLGALAFAKNNEQKKLAKKSSKEIDNAVQEFDIEIVE